MYTRNNNVSASGAAQSASASGAARLQEFFRSAQATSFIIAGHTEIRASDEYNMKLSYNRANAVADVRGYGERMPVVSNRTAGGMKQNRRVEIICVR